MHIMEGSISGKRLNVDVVVSRWIEVSACVHACIYQSKINSRAKCLAI